MSKQNLKSPSGIDAGKCLQDPFNEIDISAYGHFKGEAIGKGDVFADGFEDISILGCHYPLGSQPKVPELDEQRLQRLDLEDLG